MFYNCISDVTMDVSYTAKSGSKAIHLAGYVII